MYNSFGVAITAFGRDLDLYLNANSRMFFSSSPSYTYEAKKFRNSELYHYANYDFQIIITITNYMYFPH